MKSTMGYTTRKASKKNGIKTKERNKILMENFDIIEKICKRYDYLPVDPHTIRYGAIIGLIKAIETFSPKRGEFKRYAYSSAAQYAKIYMSKDWPISICNSKLYAFLKEKQVPYQIIRLDAQYMINKNNPYDGDCSVDNVLPELRYVDKYRDVILQETIENELNNLTLIEKEAILREYSNNTETLEEMGKRHGLTRERIRQIGFQAFKKLSFRLKKIIKTYEG